MRNLCPNSQVFPGRLLLQYISNFLSNHLFSLVADGPSVRAGLEGTKLREELYIRRIGALLSSAREELRRVASPRLCQFLAPSSSASSCLTEQMTTLADVKSVEKSARPLAIDSSPERNAFRNFFIPNSARNQIQSGCQTTAFQLSFSKDFSRMNTRPRNVYLPRYDIR